MVKPNMETKQWYDLLKEPTLPLTPESASPSECYNFLLLLLLIRVGMLDDAISFMFHLVSWRGKHERDPMAEADPKYFMHRHQGSSLPFITR